MQIDVDVPILHLNDLKKPDVMQLVRDTFKVSVRSRRTRPRLSREDRGQSSLRDTAFAFSCEEGLIAFDYDLENGPGIFRASDWRV